MTELIDAFYPPEIEPDWKTLDLDDERWYTFFDPTAWKGEPGPCTEPGCKRKRASLDCKGRRVCRYHHPYELRYQEIRALHQQRIAQLGQCRWRGNLCQAGSRQTVYPACRWEWPDSMAPSDQDENCVYLIAQSGPHNRDLYRLALEAAVPRGWSAVVEPVARQSRRHSRAGWDTVGKPPEYQMGPYVSRLQDLLIAEAIVDAAAALVARSLRRQLENHACAAAPPVIAESVRNRTLLYTAHR